MSRTSSIRTYLNWKTLLAFWILVSVANTLPSLILRGWSEGTYTYPRHLAGNLILGGWCAALTPVPLWLAGRLPIRGRRGGAHLLVHVAAAVGFSLLVIGLYLAATQRLFEHPSMPLTDQVAYMGRFFFTLVMTYYWLLVLVHHLLASADRLRDQELTAARTKELLTGARLESLRARLRPHFLFNALHAIGSLVRVERKEDALEALEELGDLLRLSLSHGEEELVPLERELAFVERYLGVEGRRFPDRLRVTYAIEPETRRAQVPSLVLQPIVENSIKHGIGAASDAGRVRVAARRDGERLRLEVADDGPGLTGGAKPPRSSPNGEGFGLASTRERLGELYGESYELRMTDVEPRGLATTLWIPWRTTEGG